MENFKDMSIEDLKAFLIAKGNEKAAIRQEMLAAKQVMERKIIERDAQQPTTIVKMDTAQAKGEVE